MCGRSQEAAGNLQAQSFRVNKVAKCFHSFCRKCLDNTMGQFDCPSCGKRVKQNTLTDKSRDAAEAELDADKRKEIRKIYNRPEESFPTAEAYRDYEEEVEDIIYALANGIDEEAVLAKVQRYAEENASMIPVYKSRKAEEEEKLKSVVARERAAAAAVAAQFQADDRAEKVRKAGEARHQNAVMLGDEAPDGQGGGLAGLMGEKDPSTGGSRIGSSLGGLHGAGHTQQQQSMSFANAANLNKKWAAYLSTLPREPRRVGAGLSTSSSSNSLTAGFSGGSRPGTASPASTPGSFSGTGGSSAPTAVIAATPSNDNTTSSSSSGAAIDMRLVGGLRYPHCYATRNLKELQASFMID